MSEISAGVAPQENDSSSSVYQKIDQKNTELLGQLFVGTAPYREDQKPGFISSRVFDASRTKDDSGEYHYLVLVDGKGFREIVVPHDRFSQGVHAIEGLRNTRPGRNLYIGDVMPGHNEGSKGESFILPHGVTAVSYAVEDDRNAIRYVIPTEEQVEDMLGKNVVAAMLKAGVEQKRVKDATLPDPEVVVKNISSKLDSLLTPAA